MLGEILNADINPAMAISGLNLDETETLYGELEALAPAARGAAIKKIATAGVAKANYPARGNSRQEFEKRLNQVNPELRKAIVTGGMAMRDAILYVTKPAEGLKAVKMFKDDDNKVIGVCNMSSGKLEKNNIFLLDGICLLSGVSATSATDPFDVDFDIIPATMRSGQFEFKANGSEIIPLSSLEVFNTQDMKGRVGYFKLDNPVLLTTQQAMEFNMEFATVGATKTHVRILLIGTMAYKK